MSTASPARGLLKSDAKEKWRGKKKGSSRCIPFGAGLTDGPEAEGGVSPFFGQGPAAGQKARALSFDGNHPTLRWILPKLHALHPNADFAMIQLPLDTRQKQEAEPMDENLLGGQIAQLRKAVGMTQEELGRAVGVSSQAVSRWECGGAPDVALLPAIADTLGVAIDKLFGREGGERLNVEDAVGLWMRSVPEGERMERFCRLVWAMLRHFTPAGIDVPKMDYLKSCYTSINGKNQTTYTKIRGGGGILVDIHADDLSFVTLAPEPKKGYTAFFAPMENCRRLFALLAKPNCLELLDSLYRKTANYFIPSVAARQSGLAPETVEGLLEELEKVGVLLSMKLELDDGEIKAYKLAEPMSFIPFFLSAQSFMDTCCNYTYFYDDEEPLLRGAEWKKEEEPANEKTE